VGHDEGMQRGAGIGITDDHRALHDTVRRWADSLCPPAVTRARLDAADDALPPFWPDLVDMGWIGLAVPEAHGGEGFGLAELVVVLEELGRRCAPGPFLPGALSAVALARFGGEALRATVVPDLAAGRRLGAVAIGCAPVAATAGPSGIVLAGTWDAVVGGALADVLVLPVDVDDGAAAPQAWAVVDAGATGSHQAGGHESGAHAAGAIEVATAPSLDRTRRAARVRMDGVTVPHERLVRCPPGAAGIDGLAALLVSAESVGLAAWCVGCAAEHAALREQFGRPIGQFQAVKHRCADMLCALEQARAATWDAAHAVDHASGVALAVAAAAALAPDAAYRCAKDCIQVLGGMGFTWEHDAHIFLKRAAANRLLVGGPRPWRAEAAERALRGERRAAAATVALPAEAAGHRRTVRAFLDDLRARPNGEWNRRIADAGYLAPHWPRPWGRDASPVEQLVIDEEFERARVRRPHLAVGAWALPTIIVHGTSEQQRRFVLPTLRGELTWCQMFSEPGAGSDLASVATKATRVDGGWLLTGQKVWTTLADVADWGICLARTDPAAPRHEGIGCFLVDMASEGIDVRPLRELTGAEMFNEVFLADVFVPDDCVVGEPTAGWAAARTTLANERVSMGRGASMGPGVEALVALVARTAPDDAHALDTLGAIVAATQATAALGARMTLRALGGAGGAPSPEASVRKLVGVELDQWVQEVGLDLLGPAAATGDGDAAGWIAGFLGNRSLSIAGGTSEIQRNVIAERLLGLPRDP
jgi:3-oxochol-4-en-24-oyl-CoA dehydrogenase